jgi:hypothetical protein
VRILAGYALVLMALGAFGCPPRGYEFLKEPRGGLEAGSQWKVGIGPLTDGPAAGVEVAEKVQGPDWLNSKTEGKGGANLAAALAGFFSAGLDVEASRIVSIEAEGLTHQQVVNPEKLTRGYAYLWETIEASKVKIAMDQGLEGELQGKIDKFAASALGQKLNLQFKSTGGSKSSYQVTGRNLVVAVKVVNFDMKARTESMTLKLGKDSQGTDQVGPFGYALAVQSGGVDLPGRKIEVTFRNPQAADTNTGTWKRTLSSGTTKIHAGPLIDGKSDCVLDYAYVSAWDAENLTCQVTFQRTTWELKQVACGLETVGK